MVQNDSGDRPKRDIRVLRRKDIADIASSVVQDKAEMH